MIYILKLSIFLSLVYLFYQLLLRRLTFYSWNRYYLLGYSLMAFFIPFINISPFLKQNEMKEVQAIQYIPVMNFDVHTWTHATSSGIENFSHPLAWQDFVLWLMLTGSSIMFIRLMIQLLSFLQMKRKAIRINDAELSIYHIDNPIIPFSFGNAIYINQGLHSEKELENIILHEYVHVRQKHTIDILLAEMICIVNWFNPFAWLLRHHIRQNLEFIADHQVLQNGINKKAYQYHLLKITGSEQYRIFNNFNFSSLQKRILMMNMMKSARMHLLKFVFLIPLLVVVLLVFRSNGESLYKKQMSLYNEAGMVVDARTGQPLAEVSILETQSGRTAITDAHGYYHFRIPVWKNHLWHFQLTKKGYKAGENEFSVPADIIGYIHVFGLFDTNYSTAKGKVEVFMTGAESFAGDPAYTDVLKVYQKANLMNKKNNEFFNFISGHPDVAYFYSSENQRQIVFLKDGSYERYGYPGGPTIEDMEKKYGSLPDVMKYAGEHAPGQDYLLHWEKISGEAEKKFRTKNPDVIHVIFPGDSRVIVVPKSGKPHIYDMDNAAPEERPAFEKIYGPLPDIVPPASNNTSKMKAAPLSYDTKSDKDLMMADTIINPKPFIQIARGLPYSLQKILVILDGKELPAGIPLNIVAPDSIESISIIKDSAARRYGERAKDGVIIIETKRYSQLKSDKPSGINNRFPFKANQSSDSVPHSADQYFANVSVQYGIVHWELEKDYPRHPLYLVDGILKGKDPNEIHIKPEEQWGMEYAGKGDILKRYGEDRKDGIVNIVTKANKDNPSAHIFGRTVTYSPDYMQAMFAEMAIRNKLYIGLENPLRIDVPGIDDEKVVVQIDKGSIVKLDGLYYVKPAVLGNALIKIYEKEMNGHLKLLNSRYFRVENLPALIQISIPDSLRRK